MNDEPLPMRPRGLVDDGYHRVPEIVGDAVHPICSTQVVCESNEDQDAAVAHRTIKTCRL